MQMLGAWTVALGSRDCYGVGSDSTTVNEIAFAATWVFLSFYGGFEWRMCR